MMKNTHALIAALAGSIALGGCQFSNKAQLLTPTAPSSATSGSNTQSTATSTSSASSSSSATGAAGTWDSSAFGGVPNLTSCTNLQWQISNLSEDAVSGSISAVCGGVVNVNANISGQMVSSDVVNLTANGQAIGLGITCPFALTGVGHLQGTDAMRLDYQGTTCAGNVSGSELLHRKAPAAPAPSAPAPAPRPDPQPTFDDGVFGCPTSGDPYQLVVCVHDHVNPHDEFGAFEVTKRVAWGLRGSGAGLLIKNAGENIVSWKGYSFSASRICYPDGHIIKVISDAGPGGANGASWQDNGYVASNLYLPALDPTQ